MVKRGDCIYYKKGSGFREMVLKEVLKIWCEKAGAELVNKMEKKCKIAIGDTLDKTSLEFIKEIFGKKKDNLLPAVGNTIKPLYLFLDKEVKLYADLKELKYQNSKEKKDKISVFVDSLEKNHPEVKRAVVNSYLQLFSSENL